MDLYIPSVSFASQYPAWAGWRSADYKKLPTKPALKTDGALLFVEGAVDQLEPLADREGFSARVTDGRAFGTAVWLDVENQTPRFECGCDKGQADTPCVHSMALLATLVYLFHEHNFIPLSPLLKNVNALAAAIDQSKPGEQKALRRIRICKPEQGAVFLEGDTALPDSFVQAINPYRELSRMARNTLELPPSRLKEALRTLVDYVRDREMILEAEKPEGGFFKLIPELSTVGIRLRFIADPIAQFVQVEPTIDRAASEATAVELGGGALVLQNGKLAIEDEEKFTPLTDAFSQMERGFTSFSYDSDAYPLEKFNDYVARLDGGCRRLFRQCVFSLIKEGTMTEAAPLEKDSLPLRAILHIDHIEKGMHRQIAYFDGSVSDEFVALNHVFADFMRKLCQHADDADRLLGRRTRVEAILDAASQLPQLKTQAERRSLIDATVDRAAFNSKRQSKAAAKFLRDLERDYCRPQSALAPMILEDSEARTYTWRAVHLPLPGLLAATATLYLHSDFQKLLGWESPELPIDLTGDAFYQLTRLCGDFDIVLAVDDETALARSAAIRIDIASDTKQDWFELKPSIRCEGIEIPPEQWQQLLEGSLLVKNAKGGLFAAQVDDPKMLAQLVETFAGKRNSGKASTKVHRLALLDWLAWRKKGLDLELPPELEPLFRSLLDFSGIPKLPLPAGLHAELRPYQCRGYEWLVFLHEHRLGACLADDMGLGKTIQSLTFLTHLKAAQSVDAPLRTLAVLPPSLLYNWESEAARFAPDLRVTTYAGTDRDPSALKSDLCLTTYDILRRDIDRLEQEHFAVVLFDEAQALKNHASRRTQAARRLDRAFTLCLTGTPLENNIGEFHSIMDTALPGLMGRRKQFEQAIKDGDDRLLRRARPFLLRRTKNAILEELPPKIESDIYLEMDEAQREIYTRIVGELREEVLSAYQKQTRAQAGISALAALTRLRQLCISPALLGHRIDHRAPKIQYLADTLTELTAEGQSVLVFSQFVKSLDQIETALRADGIEPLRLDGSTPQKKRRSAIDHFQNAETPQIFLISLKAGGVGLNLTRAGHVIHVDPWWNPSVENQASDRAHRIGQQQTVFIQRLLMRDSVEEKIMSLKARKKALFDTIVEDHAADHTGTPAITKADFEFLIG